MKILCLDIWRTEVKNSTPVTLMSLSIISCSEKIRSINSKTMMKMPTKNLHLVIILYQAKEHLRELIMTLTIRIAIIIEIPP